MENFGILIFVQVRVIRSRETCCNPLFLTDYDRPISTIVSLFSPGRYGQCWVFAGVCVSLLRVLGIASRPVTCYNSAHFCSKLGQVDRYFSTEGELVDELSRDQIW